MRLPAIKSRIGLLVAMLIAVGVTLVAVPQAANAAGPPRWGCKEVTLRKFPGSLTTHFRYGEVRFIVKVCPKPAYQWATRSGEPEVNAVGRSLGFDITAGSTRFKSGWTTSRVWHGDFVGTFTTLTCLPGTHILCKGSTDWTVPFRIDVQRNGAVSIGTGRITSNSHDFGLTVFPDP
jgi:hypothetical protein